MCVEVAAEVYSARPNQTSDMFQPALLAGLAVIAGYAGPTVTLRHEFTQYGHEHGLLEVSCGALWATSNGHGEAMGIGACEKLLTAINTDDTAVYVVINTNVADSAAGLDIAATAAITLIVAAAVSAISGTWFAPGRQIAPQTYALAAVAALVMLNYASALVGEATSAPDPYAITDVNVGFGAAIIAATPLLGLVACITSSSEQR